ncbi:BadF/BadG/BcrA/BcrD ATPase family protein [Streptomyces shenzhenensis]|uniref:BadF/BadG/BcrA/BcrD ATPase family protein n=1 Tax=Streptomyces shenzhenensis TaxID=943815 RepID=UPI0038077347
MPSRLLVDVGQTGTRLRIESDAAETIDDDSVGVRPGSHPESYLAQVAHETLSRHQVRVDTVAAGLSGLQGAGGDAESVLDRLVGFGVTHVVLADDAVTGYLAALALAPGVVLSVGTGVVALATTGDQALARVNGWGHLLGDDGGGYWIGRAGLHAALCAFDGRGPRTLLLDAAAARIGPAQEIGVTLQLDPDRVRTIAAFAKDVLDLAAGGDRVATEIRAAAAAELARNADAAARRAGDAAGGQIPVSWSGSLLTAQPVLREALQLELARLDSRYLLTPPGGTQLDGARLLTDLPATHPLAALVRRASSDS